MKWALLFYILGLSVVGKPVIVTQIIVKTFVAENECHKALYEELQRANRIAAEAGLKDVSNMYFSCIKYVGPWKTEISLK